jgi:hypothetical protein
LKLPKGTSVSVSDLFQSKSHSLTQSLTHLDLDPDTLSPQAVLPVNTLAVAMAMSFIDHTAEVHLQEVLSMLPVRDRLLFARTCRRVRNLASHDSVWRNTPIELEIRPISASESLSCTFRVRPWLSCSTHEAAAWIAANAALTEQKRTPPRHTRMPDRLDVDSMSHADRLECMANLSTLDLERDEYKSLRRGQCAWQEESGGYGYTGGNLLGHMLTPGCLEWESLLIKHAAISLVYFPHHNYNYHPSYTNASSSAHFLHRIVHHTSRLRSRVVRFAVESTRDKASKVELQAVYGALEVRELAELFTFIASEDGFMPRLQALSMRQCLLDAASTTALISVLHHYTQTLTQLNLSACGFEEPAPGAHGRQLLGDALGACEVLRTVVCQRSNDMHEVVLHAIERQAGRNASLPRIAHIDLAGIFLPPPFVARMRVIASRLRVLRVSDGPMNGDLLVGVHTSYAEQAAFFHMLRDALLRPHSCLEAVVIAYSGFEFCHRRLIRRLAHALQVAYARHGMSADTLTPGDPDFPTA